MGIFNEQSPNASESYVDEAVSTASGVAQSFLDLTDTPESYSDGYYLVSTSSGINFTPAEYSNIDGGAAASNFGGITGVDGGNASSF
jgi:hypothetical protein